MYQLQAEVQQMSIHRDQAIKEKNEAVKEKNKAVQELENLEADLEAVQDEKEEVLEIIANKLDEKKSDVFFKYRKSIILYLLSDSTR